MASVHPTLAHIPEACALRPDLALMPQGDMTEVGEKGELDLGLCSCIVLLKQFVGITVSFSFVNYLKAGLGVNLLIAAQWWSTCAYLTCESGLCKGRPVSRSPMIISCAFS